MNVLKQRNYDGNSYSTRNWGVSECIMENIMETVTLQGIGG